MSLWKSHFVPINENVLATVLLHAMCTRLPSFTLFPTEHIKQDKAADSEIHLERAHFRWKTLNPPPPPPGNTALRIRIKDILQWATWSYGLLRCCMNARWGLTAGREIQISPHIHHTSKTREKNFFEKWINLWLIWLPLLGARNSE